MKGIVWNCKKVKWQYTKGDVICEKDCLLVYVCCENGDNLKQLKEVNRRINQLNRKRFKKRNLVIFPFAHLSDNILDHSEASNLITNLACNLDKTMKVSIMRFNTNKKVDIHLLPGNKDVSYFSY